MNRIILTAILSLFLAATAVHAQKIDVSIKKNVISINDEPYCKFEGGGGLDNTFTLYNLNDELLIRGKIERAEGYYSDARQPQPAWYVFTFAGYTLYRPECLPDIGFRKKIAKELYRYKVISPDGSLNEAGIKEFCNFYSEKISDKYNPKPAPTVVTNTTVVVEQPKQQDGISIGIGGVRATIGGNNNPTTTTVVTTTTASSPVYSVATRNRNERCLLLGTRLEQDHTTIGSIAKSVQQVYDININVITFFLPDGSVAAEVKQADGSNKYNIYTPKDQKTITITLEAANETSAIEKLAAQLIAGFYL